MILLNHRVCNVKTFYSLQHHNGSGSSNGYMKSAEELIPGIAVHSRMEEPKDKVHNSRNLANSVQNCEVLCISTTRQATLTMPCPADVDSKRGFSHKYVKLTRPVV